MGNLDLEDSLIDPFLELAPFSARSERPHNEILTTDLNPKTGPQQTVKQVPISIHNLKAHLPFLATHLQEALAESVSSENSNQVCF
ncbi:unnamed protein product [Trichobilharzia regenti]|nr:unnamed protein product [Trichobilharzia regenti]